MKTLYITDLDGTLLNNERKLSAFTKEYMNELIKKGVLFTYATARSLSSAKVVTEGLEICMPIISNNGTFIVDPNTKEKLVSNFFDTATIDVLKEVFRNLDANPLVYAFQQEVKEGNERISWITGRESEGLRYYIDQRQNDNRMHPLGKEAKEEQLYKGEIFYFTCIGTREELLPIYEAVKDKKEVNCILHQELYREEYWCEIMPRDATKAKAMLKLKELYECDQVVCFGDGENDIPMFLEAEQSYAMENAVPELKSIATDIIGHNNQDGVARWMISHFGRE